MSVLFSSMEEVEPMGLWEPPNGNGSRRLFLRPYTLLVRSDRPPGSS